MKKNGEFVGVDEKFIPEDEKYVDESMLGDREKTKKTVKKVAKGFGIGWIVFLIILIVIIISIGIITVKIFSSGLGMFSDVGSYISGTGSQIESMREQQEIDTFNGVFEIYSGTQTKISIGSLLDEVVTNNKKNSDKIITVTYNETTTTDTDEIVDLKQYFKTGKNYEVIFDYGTNGLINKVTIKDI